MAINPNEIYTTSEAQKELRVSNSTIKRLLKRGVLRANKIGGQYRIMGKEMLKILSPTTEKRAVKTYQKIKRRVKEKIKYW